MSTNHEPRKANTFNTTLVSAPSPQYPTFLPQRHQLFPLRLPLILSPSTHLILAPTHSFPLVKRLFNKMGVVISNTLVLAAETGLTVGPLISRIPVSKLVVVFVAGHTRGREACWAGHEKSGYLNAIAAGEFKGPNAAHFRSFRR